jgi:hypothetical protein
LNANRVISQQGIPVGGCRWNSENLTAFIALRSFAGAGFCCFQFLPALTLELNCQVRLPTIEKCKKLRAKDVSKYSKTRASKRGLQVKNSEVVCFAHTTFMFIGLFECSLDLLKLATTMGVLTGVLWPTRVKISSR